jgi:hypothetical protein
MRRIVIASVIAVFFVGGSVAYYAAVRSPSPVSTPPKPQPPHVPVPDADAAKFAGTYYHGDGLGMSLHLTLKPDGSYAATWHGCLGLYGEATGNWRVSAKTLILSPFEEKENMVGYLRTLDIVDDGKRVVFVQPEDRAHFKEYGVHQYWCFQRTDQMPKRKKPANP